MKKQSLALQKKEKVTANINSAVVVASLEKQARPLIGKLEKLLVIKTQEDYENAGKFLKQLKDLGKVGKAEKDKFLNPLKELTKVTNNHFKPFENLLESTESATKEGMMKFIQAREAKKEKLDESFEKGDIKKIGTYLKKSQEINAGNEHVQERSKTVVKITNLKKIPIKFLEPNLKLIKEALESGQEVPGAVLDKEVVLAV